MFWVGAILYVSFQKGIASFAAVQGQACPFLGGGLPFVVFSKGGFAVSAAAGGGGRGLPAGLSGGDKIPAGQSPEEFSCPARSRAPPPSRLPARVLRPGGARPGPTEAAAETPSPFEEKTWENPTHPLPPPAQVHFMKRGLRRRGRGRLFYTSHFKGGAGAPPLKPLLQ